MGHHLLAALLLIPSIPLLGQQQPVRPAITGVAFMRVYTTDPSRAQKFYGQTLGFERKEMGREWVYPVNHLQWIEVTPTAPPKPNCMLGAVGFMTRDAKGLERYLRAHNVEPEQPLQRGEFSVRDPEGNTVIFVQSGANVPEALAAANAQQSGDATSRRIIHVGFIVRDRDKEEAFWRGILGFRPYWYGTMHPGRIDFVSLQVPDGSDWLEFMLNMPADPSLHDSGMMDHFSLGVTEMNTVLAGLQHNGCEGKMCTAIQAGVDGKVQLNLFDPDQTRVEYMEFTPAMNPCCSPFTGKHPTAEENR